MRGCARVSKGWWMHPGEQGVRGEGVRQGEQGVRGEGVCPGEQGLVDASGWALGGLRAPTDPLPMQTQCTCLRTLHPSP